jgi:hypothetical protein
MLCIWLVVPARADIWGEQGLYESLLLIRARFVPAAFWKLKPSHGGVAI